MHKHVKSTAAEVSYMSNTRLNLLHVVRRYGPVGGMERYVWELTLQLNQLGYKVTVVCERCHVDKPEGITVVELGEVLPRPRWLAAVRFDRRVVRWLAKNPQADTLIHSHERISPHNITTFHASPFATIFEKSWWKLISLRAVMQLFLERRELKNARSIVPNSLFIKEQLAHYYPEFAHKLTEPVMPGVTATVLRPSRKVSSEGGVIGFIGKEWKRKGLHLVVAVVKKLRLTRPELKLVVIGPDVSDIQHLFSDWQGGYVLNGWLDKTNYSDFDVLFHPAKAEPYGMVISEAMAARVPVVISDMCGAGIHVTSSAGAVLPLNARIDSWVATLELQLSRTEQVPKFERSWQKVAQEYEIHWHEIDRRSKSEDSPYPIASNAVICGSVSSAVTVAM